MGQLLDQPGILAQIVAEHFLYRQCGRHQGGRITRAALAATRSLAASGSSSGRSRPASSRPARNGAKQRAR